MYFRLTSLQIPPPASAGWHRPGGIDWVTSAGCPPPTKILATPVLSYYFINDNGILHRCVFVNIMSTTMHMMRRFVRTSRTLEESSRTSQ